MDGKACWPGLDIKIPVMMNNNTIGEARDDQYLYNMDRIDKLFKPKMFKESFLGKWSMDDEDAKDKVEDSSASFKEFFQTEHLHDKDQHDRPLPQARMALKLLDIETVGQGRNEQIPSLKSHEAGVEILQDKDDPTGPKL